MPDPEYLLALDQGTTSCRAILFDRQGAPISVAQEEFKQHYPQSGWVEHDPEEIWKSQRKVVLDALEKEQIQPESVAAAGITNQRETIVVWDRKSGRPIHPAIVWQDRRTADYCKDLKEKGAENEVREKTGLFLDPYFSATKVRWILDNVEGAQAKAENGDLALGTLDSWLVWKATGGKAHLTDISNASRTLLFNIIEQAWDPDLLDLFSIPKSMLPEVRSSAETYGELQFQEWEHSVPIAGIAGDQQAALFGQACFEVGMAKNTYGTGCFLLLNTGEEPVPSENNLITTIGWRIGNTTEYALEGSVFIAGAVVQWLRDELKIIETSQECDELAASVADSGGAFLVPAFAGLGAPHWDPFARGAAFGLTRATNRAHLCRAALESIAFQSADLIQAMEKDSGVSIRELRVDGGASRSEPMLQFQADLLQTEVVRPSSIETTALGAAYLAGLGSGFYGDRQEIVKNWTESARFSPQADPESMAEKIKAWNEAVDRTKNWIPSATS